MTAVTAGKATNAQKAVVAAVTVALLAITGGVYFMLRSQVRVLSPTDTASLKEVFFSGEPWLVECSKKGSTASPVVYDAEGSLKGVKIGVMDCTAVLPSGKSTYERFKLREPTYGPVILSAANSERPQIAPRNVLSSGAALAEWGTQMTTHKIYSPSSSSAFDGQCLRKAWCILVVTASGRLNDAERVAVQTLAAAERRVRVVKVDISKSNLLVDLPDMPTPTTGEATVLMLKQLERSDEAAASEAATPNAEADGDSDEDEDEDPSAPPVAVSILSSGLKDVGAARGAIAAAFASAEAVPPMFTRLAKRPSLKPKRAPPSSTPQQTYQSSPSQPEPAAKTLTDAELKAMREERARLIKEAEQQRRAKMAAEEANAANIIEEVDAEEPAGGGSPFAAEEEGYGEGEEAAAEEEEEIEAEEFE